MDVFIFRDRDILITHQNHELPSERDAKNFQELHLICDIYTENANEIYTARFQDGEKSLPPKFEFIQLREYFATSTPEKAAKAARAKGLLSWNSDTIFCQKCGTRLEHDGKVTAKNCPSCKAQFFPRIEPCIITLISRGDEVLLARHKMRIQNIYTCIAGFIEIGESAEHAVIREVREEVGIEIKDVRYCVSQSWPFPDQLMLAFRAEYAGGDIKIQQDELLEAKWFHRSNIPNIPARGSVAYRLISGEFD